LKAERQTIKQAVILAGGEGRRLLPYTRVLPKPLWPVGDAPIVETLLRQLARAGIREAIMAVGYQADLIKTIIGDGRQFGLKVRYSLEKKPLGTAGPLKKIAGLDENFLVLNGDLLTNLSFQDFIRVHLKKKVPASVAVYRRSVRVDFGVVADKENKIIDYREKPILKYSVSMGIYAFRREILKLIPGKKFDFPDLVHRLISTGQNPAIYRFNGIWLDIGRPDDWEKADALVRKRRQLFSP
jgi:NDP-sugar pyrophosphorylase family protein